MDPTQFRQRLQNKECLVELGYRLLIGGGDAAFLREGSTQRTEMMRQVLGQYDEKKSR